MGTMPAEYISEYKIRRTRERRQQAIEFLGGRCVKCSSTEDLQFDHIDPSTKSFEITPRLWCTAWEKLVEELSKCQLLCPSCHRKKTIIGKGFTVAKGKGTHGTVSAYRYCGPPKCEDCKRAKRETPSYKSRRR